MEHLARHESYERELFLIEANHPEEIPSGLSLPCPYFVCLIAWDAREASDEAVITVAARFLRAGCVYICCWGPDCERVHDLFDSADLKLRPEGPWAMSTWHSDEPLSEALWFLLSCTWPDDAFFAGCHATVGVTIGSSAWSKEMRSAFSSPDEFCNLVLKPKGC